MSANTALVTEAAKSAVRNTLADYSAGVFAHITGDWSQHNQVKVYTQPFTDAAGHVDTVATLRVVLTQGVTDYAIAIPINATGTSALVNSPPIISVQPESQNALVGATVQFIVGAISDITIAYQWYKGGVLIPNQVQSQLVLTGVQIATDVASYYVVVSNANGSVTSDTVNLAIGGVGGGVSTTDRSFLETLIDPFNLFGF